MRSILLILFSAIALFGQCPTGPAFPSAVATDATLAVAANNVTTTLKNNMAIDDSVAVVTSTTGWAVNMMATVDSEIMFVTGVTGNNVLTVTRHCEGTSAAVHVKGKTIDSRQTAYVGSTSAKNEIKAIETKLQAAIVNVAEYGAVGDGTTDDQPAIQAALDHASAISGGVTCGNQQKTYYLGASLHVKSHTTLDQCSFSVHTAVAIQMRQGNGDPSVQYIHISDVTITGNNTVGSGGLYIGGTNGNFVHDITLDRVHVFQTDVPLETGNGFYHTWRNLDLGHNLQGWNHTAELYATTMNLYGVAIRDNLGPGINNLAQIQGLFCYSCFIERNAGTEIVAGHLTNGSFYGTYTETTANGVTLASTAFDLTNSTQVLISGGFYLRHKYLIYSGGGMENVEVDGVYAAVGFGDARSIDAVLVEGSGNRNLDIRRSKLMLPVVSNAVNTTVDATFDKAFSGGELSDIKNAAVNQIVQQAFGAFASKTGTNFIGRRTNLLTGTAHMDASPWTTTGGTTTAATGQTNPFGTSEAWKLAETAVTDHHFASQSFLLTGEVPDNSDITFSISLKQAERATAQLDLVDRDGNERYCYIKLDTGTILYSSNPPQCNLVSQGNGWYRATIQGNIGSHTLGNPGIGTGAINIGIRNGSDTYYLGTAGYGFYMFGPMMTLGFQMPGYYENPSLTAVVDQGEAIVANDLEVKGNVIAPKLLAPALNTIVLFGDSITLESGGEALVYQDASLSARYSAYENGLFAWANAILGQRFQIIFNAGIGGNTTTQMLARVDTDVIAYHPRWCMVLGGTNDIGSAGSAANAILKLQRIYAKLVAAGIKVIVATIPPASAASGNATFTAEWLQLNQWIRTNAVSQGFALVDLGTVYPDVTSIYPTNKSGYSVDGTHPSLKGGIALGQAVANALSFVPPVSSVLPITNTDTENLITNAYMNGTGGSLASLTGSVADSWTAKFNGTSSAKSASKVAAADGQGSWQQLSMTGGSGSEIWMEQAISTGWAAGDKLTAYCEFQTDAGMDGQLDLTVIVTATDTNHRFTSHSGYPVDTVGAQPPTTGVLKSGVGILPADPLTVTVHVGFTGTAGTLRLRKVRLVKVP